MLIDDAVTRPRPRPGTDHPDRRAAWLALASFLVVALVVGGWLVARWVQVQPLGLGPASGGGSVPMYQLPHLLRSVWLVDQPAGVAETLPLQLSNDGSRSVTLDSVDPLLYPNPAPELRRVDEHLVPYGPPLPVAGYVLRPGEGVELEFSIRALGCDGTGTDPRSGGVTGTGQVTVHFHRLHLVRTAVLAMDPQLVVTSGSGPAPGRHLTCVAPSG